MSWFQRLRRLTGSSATDARTAEHPSPTLVRAIEASERHYHLSMVYVTLSADAWHAFSLAWTNAYRQPTYGPRSLAAPHTLKIWNRHNGSVLRTYEFDEFGESGHPVAVRDPDGAFAASVKGGVLRLWSPTTELEVAQLKCEPSSFETHVTQLALTEDDKLAVLATTAFYRRDNNTMTIWNLQTGSLRKLEGHSKTVLAVSAIPDGRWPDTIPRHRAFPRHKTARSKCGTLMIAVRYAHWRATRRQ